MVGTDERWPTARGDVPASLEVRPARRWRGPQDPTGATWGIGPMTLPCASGLREYGKRGPPRAAADRADAGQGHRQGARRPRGVVLRTQVGRLPGAGLP